jgi:phosphoglycolate phosphatase
MVFDCDGTLVDSQYVIYEAMRRTLEAAAEVAPGIDAVRRVVGLSLVEAIGQLRPDLSADDHVELAASYRLHYQALRREHGVVEPMFPEVASTLRALDRAGLLLALATGKSRRGVERVLAHHGLDRLFVSVQTADDNPSKPHPAMLERAIEETRGQAHETVFVGDTTFDMMMARGVGARGIGVAHGYHAADELLEAGAERVIDRFEELLDLPGLAK